MRILTGFIDRLVFAAGVIVFLQLPHFIDQYTQRVGGFYDAERAHLEKYQAIADQNFGGSLDALIEEFKTSSNNAVRQTGEQVATTRETMARLRSGLDRLESSDLLQKITYLATHLDYELAKSTLRVFQPGAPFSLGAFVSGVIGGMLFSLLFHVALRLFAYIFTGGKNCMLKLGKYNKTGI